MRSFATFKQAKLEIPRDLNELGIDVHAGYQSKNLEELDPETFRTKELQNYDYTVLRPDPDDLNPVQPWAGQEWHDRLQGIEGNAARNPGSSWKMRPDIWAPLLEQDGKFSYTYGERLFRTNVPAILAALKQNTASRQAYIGIWDPGVDGMRLGKRRVPCSLGYQIMVREGRVHLTYHMRSSDYATHWDNDVWLALQLQRWFCRGLVLPPGSFTHILSSLHVYAREVSHAF